MNDIKKKGGNNDYRRELNKAVLNYENRIRTLNDNIAELNKTRNRLKSDLIAREETVEAQRELLSKRESEIQVIGSAKMALEEVAAKQEKKIRDYEVYRGLCWFLMIILMLILIGSNL